MLRTVLLNDISGAGADDSGEAMVRVDALRRIDELFLQLGTSIEDVFSRCQIEPSVLQNRHAMLSLRAVGTLFDRAAQTVACPDFAKRLSDLQRGEKVLGPLDIAMRHASTPRQALAVLADCIRAYTPALQIRVATADRDEAATVVHFSLVDSDFSGAAAFTDHAARTAAHVLRDILPAGSPVVAEGVDEGSRGAEAVAMIRLDSGLLDCPNGAADPLIRVMALDFIQTRYPTVARVVSDRVRANMPETLKSGQSTARHMALLLGMTTRTLQRRLKSEGVSYEDIRDDVRREIAGKALRANVLPLARLAALLGYSSAGALSRNCIRWFGLTPRQLIDEAACPDKP